MSVLTLQQVERASMTATPTVEERALAGDRDAWQELIARHERKVLFSLIARGVRVDRARELAQETWARLIEQQRLGRFERLELPGLAIAQARFLALKLERHAGSEAEEVEVRDEVTPEEAYFSREQLRRAQAVLERCSPSAQHVFRLVYEQPQLRHQEIAERVGLSLQRVRQILCETRKVLRAALEEQ